MRIVTRAEWGARKPTGVKRITTPTQRLWLHHSASEQHGTAGVRAIQAYHMDSRGWADIGYSFLVDEDGTVFEGRGAGVAGAHTEGDNTRSHGICALGNYEHRPPPSELLDALRELIAYGQDEGWWLGLSGGHQDAPNASTACPGRHLYRAIPSLRLRPKEDVMPTPQDLWSHPLGPGNDHMAPAGNRLFTAEVHATQARDAAREAAAAAVETRDLIKRILAAIEAG